MFHVKGKLIANKAWWFVTHSGGLNRLRIHAACFRDKQSAETAAAELKEDNPGYTFKVVS